MKIGIDLDGVVFDSETTFRTYEELYDILELKGNNLIDRGEPKHQRRYNWTKDEEDTFRNKYYLKVSQESGLMAGFLAVYRLLKEQGHTLIVITARGHDIPKMRDDAERILRENNIQFDRYYWGAIDKLEICKKENVDYMIDDDWHIIDTLASNGIRTIYFRDTDMKKLRQNKYIKEVNNWGDVFRFLKSVSNE